VASTPLASMATERLSGVRENGDGRLVDKLEPFDFRWFVKYIIACRVVRQPQRRWQCLECVVLVVSS
jgi:hypothetical protein